MSIFDSIDVGIVLGSGLGSLANDIDISESNEFSALGLPCSKVAGHAGKFLSGKLFGKNVMLMQGRVHLYEGHSAKDVTAGIRYMHSQGIKKIILTNAAGTLNPSFTPGSWMLLNDHLNLTSTSPLEGGANFIDMSHIYDPSWCAQAVEIAHEHHLTLHQGVYAGLRGPQYETPAEIRMLKTLGADAVGMSTVLEAIQAHALGMKVLAFSCLTNWAAGIHHSSLSHQEVLDTGKQAAAEMRQLLSALLE